MTFFVDANAIVYGAVEGPGRESCLLVMEAIARGEVDGRTSPAVLEEVWHVVRRRWPERLEGLVESAVEIFTPLLPVTEDALRLALRMGDSSLDPNDRLHVGTCLSNEIGVVLTADRAYEEAAGIERVDPLDPAAVERLLSAARG